VPVLWGGGRSLHLQGLSGLQQPLPDLVAQGAHAAGAVRDEHGGGPRGGRHLLQGVEVLVHEQELHDLRLRDVRVGGEHADGVMEAEDDRLPLLREADPRQALALGVRLRRLDHRHLLRLGLIRGGDAEALRGVDLVHRLLHCGVGFDVGDEGLDDGVPEVVHLVLQLRLQRLGDLVLGEEELVELVLRDLRPYVVEDVGVELLVGEGELVERLPDARVQHLEHDCHRHDDEDVVPGLGLHLDVELPRAEGQPSGQPVAAGDEAALVKMVMKETEKAKKKTLKSKVNKIFKSKRFVVILLQLIISL